MFTNITQSRVHSSFGYPCSYTSPSSSCDGCSWELESHVESSDRYLGRCLNDGLGLVALEVALEMLSLGLQLIGDVASE